MTSTRQGLWSPSGPGPGGPVPSAQCPTSHYIMHRRVNNVYSGKAGEVGSMLSSPGPRCMYLPLSPMIASCNYKPHLIPFPPPSLLPASWGAGRPVWRRVSAVPHKRWAAAAVTIRATKGSCACARRGSTRDPCATHCYTS